MPPTQNKEKKQSGGAQSAGAQKKQKTGTLSKDDYFKRLEAAQEKHKCVGSMLVVGVDSGGSDDESEPDEEPEYTAEQILQLRHILITEARAKALEKADDFCSCGQSAGGFAMFNTSDGNQICAGIPKEVQAALKKKTLPERFDALFALTHGLKNYDFWMNDNECWEPGQELEKAIKTLGKAWRDMLKNSDALLGIDGEFTRPGIEALLSQLQDDFASCEPTADYPFKWRA